MNNKDIIRELEGAIISGIQSMKCEDVPQGIKESLTALQSIVTITTTMDNKFEPIVLSLLSSISLILLSKNVGTRLAVDFSEKVAVILMLQRILGGGDG